MPAPPVRILAIACGVVLLAGVIGAATYDSDDSVTLDQASSDVETAETSTTTIAPIEGTTPPTEPPTTETTLAPTTAAPTTAPPTTVAPTTAPPTTEAPTVGTTPGTYEYDTTGTANGEKISGTSTLVVAEVGTDGRQEQVQSGPEGKTVTTYRHALEGTFLESLALESPQGSFTLTAVDTFLLIPADAAAGTTTTGTLTGEGLTANVTFTITAMDADRTTATLEVDLDGKIQGFDVAGTMDSTIVARTSDQLPLDTTASSDIAAGGGLVRITSETRTVLRR